MPFRQVWKKNTETKNKVRKWPPKWNQNASPNRPNIDPGTTLDPDMCQRWSKRASNHRCSWFSLDFGSIFDRCWINFWLILYDFRPSIPSATDFGIKRYVRRKIRIDHDRRTPFSLFWAGGIPLADYNMSSTATARQSLQNRCDNIFNARWRLLRGNASRIKRMH